MTPEMFSELIRTLHSIEESLSVIALVAQAQQPKKTYEKKGHGLVRAELVKAVVKIIKARGEPVRIRDLLTALVRDGIVFESENPMKLLQTALYRSKDQIAKNQYGYCLVNGRQTPLNH